MSGLFAKALMPIATSIFRKSAPLGFGGIRSFFSKAPSLASVSSGLGKISRVGNAILDSPVADVLASQVGGQSGLKGLNVARKGLKGVESAKGYTDSVKNILEKVNQAQPKKQTRPMPTPEEVGLPMPPRMPVAFDGGGRRGGGYR